MEKSTFKTKAGLAQMLKGGVIMDVVTPEQARIAEEAGAVAVMALERVPADIRKQGGVARMSDPEMILGIIEAVTIPVMAKARIGHFVEAQVLESLGVNFAAGGIATPADAALMMQLGVDGVFVGSGIFKSGDPARRAKAIVEATTHYNDARIIAEVSKGLGEAMVGINIGDIPQGELLATRGW
jgi:pyridoxal biosynthesis lyase PdxS